MSTKRKRGGVNTCSVLLTWFIGSKLLWEWSNIFSCCDLLGELLKTLRINIMSPEAVTLLSLLPSSLLR